MPQLSCQDGSSSCQEPCWPPAGLLPHGCATIEVFHSVILQNLVVVRKAERGLYCYYGLSLLLLKGTLGGVKYLDKH